GPELDRDPDRAARVHGGEHVLLGGAGGEESDIGGGRERDQVAWIDLRGDVSARRHHDVDRPGERVAEDFARVGEGEVERGRAHRGHRHRRQRDRRAEERGEGDGHEVAAGLGREGARRVHLVGREEDADLVARVDEGCVHRADAGGVVGEPRRAVAPLDRLRGHTRAEEAEPQSERGEPRAGLVRQSQQRSIPPWSLRGRRDCRAALYLLSTGTARFGTAPRRVSRFTSASLGGACWCNRDHGMTRRSGACVRLTGLLALLALAGRAAAQTGDSLCDARQSTADTCVIAADQTLPDGSVLTFTKPNVRVRSNLTFGRCAPDPATACASDADCAPPARCLRTAETIQVAGLLSLDAGAKITARGKAAAGDAIGPDGGAITLSARDVSIAGTVGVSAEGTTGVPAGHAG